MNYKIALDIAMSLDNAGREKIPTAITISSLNFHILQPCELKGMALERRLLFFCTEMVR